MMNKILFGMILCVSMFGHRELSNAQSIFGSSTKTETTKNKEVSNDTTANKLKEDDFPSYTCRKVYELDSVGNRLKNEDGTDKYRVFLYDKNGNKVSSEAIDAQTKKINNAILRIVAKVALIIIISKDALVGFAAGIGLSVNDIMLVVKLKSESNKQKKALEAYKKSFDEEGNPTVAKVDSKTIKLLGLTEENSTSESTEKIKEELSSASFNEIESNESLDALFEAYEKI